MIFFSPDQQKWLRARLRGTPQVEKVVEDTDIRTDSGSSGDDGESLANIRSLCNSHIGGSRTFVVTRVKIKDAPLGNPVFRRILCAFFRPKIRQLHFEGG